MANIKKYTKDNHPKQISEHFSYKEMCCPHCGVLIVDMNEVDKMEQLRNTLNTPITISSWYRCKYYNAKVGGGSSSAHLLGSACDFYCGHVKNAISVLDIVNKIFNGKRFGIYQSKAKGYAFIHADCSNINNLVWVSHLVNGKNSYTYYKNYDMLLQALLSDPKINWKNTLI